jgi:hypothetical protein
VFGSSELVCHLQFRRMFGTKPNLATDARRRISPSNGQLNAIDFPSIFCAQFNLVSQRIETIEIKSNAKDR